MPDVETKIRAAWEFRRKKVLAERLQAFRLVNGSGDGLEGLAVDDFDGSFFVVLKKAEWADQIKPLETSLRNIGEELHPEKKIEVFTAENFGDGFRWLTEKKSEFTIEEGECRYEIHLGESQHPGLFLDQRDNRKRVRAHAGGKDVLNLFCHTGAFSVVALHGHARQVHSVDLSKNYLSWFQKNLTLNGFESSQAPVYAEDVFDFLKTTKERYDLIIVDPPSFSRGKGGSFSTEKDLELLLNQSAEVLSPGGKMFASINTEKMSLTEFNRRAKETLKPHSLRVLEVFPLPFDFRLSEAERQNPYLKSCWIG